MNNENQINIGTNTAKKNTAIKPGNDTGALKTFFIDGLKDMLWAEKAIIPGLQKLQKLSTCEQLTEAFEAHEQQTQRHIARLEKIFQVMGEKPEAKKCKAMEGILKEVEEMVDATPEYSATRDAVAIIAAQKVEHYEIASYGGLVAVGHTLGLSQVANMLQKTLDEEEQTDYNLTDIAESHINFEAHEEAEEPATAST